MVDLLLGPDGAFFCGSVVFCDGGSDALLRTNDWPAAWDISVADLGRTALLITSRPRRHPTVG